MDWLLQLDDTLFRFINLTLSNPLFDVVMPWLSGNDFFVWIAALAAAALVWASGRKGLLCVLMIAVVVLAGDTFICFPLKKAIGRPRPYVTIPETKLLTGKGRSDQAMPSSHAANWFAVSTVLFIYYRRRAWPVLIPAVLVSFSRVYNGAHHPGDVLASALLGSAYATVFVFGLDALWRWAGKKWFPQWMHTTPSLITPNPVTHATPRGT